MNAWRAWHVGGCDDAISHRLCVSCWLHRRRGMDTVAAVCERTCRVVGYLNTRCSATPSAIQGGGKPRPYHDHLNTRCSATPSAMVVLLRMHEKLVQLCCCERLEVNHALPASLTPFSRDDCVNWHPKAAIFEFRALLKPASDEAINPSFDFTALQMAVSAKRDYIAYLDGCKF
jgi:hypothetical protein